MKISSTACSSATVIFMWRKISGLVLITIVLLGTICISSTPAQAVVTKTVHVDCLAQQPGWVWGTVYLFPQEALTITFEDCEWDLYADSDPDPTVNNLSPSQGSGDGSITFSTDGTYVISSNMTFGSNQGTWFTDGNSDNFVWLEAAGAQNPLAFIGVDVVQDDVTTLTGKTLLASPAVNFPTNIDASSLMVADPAIDSCLLSPSSLGETYMFVETPFTTNVSGDVTIRTISTNPITSFTDYLLQSDGYRGMTPLLNVNHLVYENFDPQHPAEGLIGCGEERGQGGDYLSSGQILSERYFETNLSLLAGEYTIVSMFVFPTTAADWNANVGWTPFAEQAVNAEIWGPTQLAPKVTPTLAQTGMTLGGLWVVSALTGAGAVLLLMSRKRKSLD